MELCECRPRGRFSSIMEWNFSLSQTRILILVRFHRISFVIAFYYIEEVQYLALCKYYSASLARNSCVTLRKRHVLTFFVDESATWRSRDHDLVSRLKLKLSLRVSPLIWSSVYEKLSGFFNACRFIETAIESSLKQDEFNWFIVLGQRFYHLNVPSTHIEETNLISRDLNICAYSWETSIVLRFYEENTFSSDFCVIERFAFQLNRPESLWWLNLSFPEHSSEKILISCLHQPT